MTRRPARDHKTIADVRKDIGEVIRLPGDGFVMLRRKLGLLNESYELVFETVYIGKYRWSRPAVR